MTVFNQSELKQEFSKWKPDRIAEIIDKLVGGKSSLRVDVQDIRLTIDDKLYEVAGELDFNVIHKKNGNASYGAVKMSQEQRDNRATAFESGRVLISTGDLEVLRVKVAGRQLDLDVEDKQFMKRVMKFRNESYSQESRGARKESE